MDRVRPKSSDRKTLTAEQMEDIVTAYESALLRYAARLVNNMDSAQDVVQNAFIKLFNSATAPLDGPQLKSWLYRVTHNEAVDLIRRETRLRRLHSEQAEACELNNPIAASRKDRTHDDRLAAVREKLHHLHPREQQVLLLRLQEGLTYKEIAEVMGRSTGNIGNILHHAVRKLSQRFCKEARS